MLDECPGKVSLFAIKWTTKSKLLIHGIRIMKVVTVILLAACLQVSAKGYTQNISLRVQNEPLREVFSKIQSQSGYTFFYSDGVLRNAKLVTATLADVPLKEALDAIFEVQPLSYMVVQKVIVVKEKAGEPSLVSDLPPLDIRGKVSNEGGQPVEGVTVTVRGKGVSTNTDANGEFSLFNVEGNAVLVFTHVSMQTSEYRLSAQQTNINITLKNKFSDLRDVEVKVNTGYQQISKERFVGSFAQLDSANYHRRAGMNIIDRLDGTVPGVVFHKKGSIYPIQVRGISTLNNSKSPSSAPLIVMDEFPMDERFNINSINPNDVENITVLKDAAAASIWGTRAANGVIVITTKKGHYGKPIQVSVSSNVTITDKPDLYHFPKVRSSDFIDVEKDLFSKGYYDGLINNTTSFPSISPVVEILARERSGLLTADQATAQIDAFRNVDLRDQLDRYIYRAGVSQQHYLNFGGGTNNLAYQVSFGYNNNLNAFQGSKPDDQFTASSGLSFKPAKNLELKFNLSLSQATQRSAGYSDNARFPYLQLADANGNSMVIPYLHRQGYIDTVGGGQLLDWHYNPLDEIRLANNKSQSRFAIFNVGANYKILPWLTASVAYQYTTNTSRTRNLKSLEMFETRNLINRFTNLSKTVSSLRNPVPMGAILDLNNSQATQANVRGSLSVTKSWNGEHELGILMSVEASESKGDANAVRLYGYSDNIGSYANNIDYLNRYPIFFVNSPGSLGTIPSGNAYSEAHINRFVSVLGNTSYTFRQKYTVYASARRDGSNVFGVKTNNKWKPLWSAGASWDIARESFFKMDWLSTLRLRGSYGYTGNVNNQLSGVFTIFYSNFIDGLTGLQTATPNDPSNPNLRWEQVRTINLGLDFSLLKDRLSGSFEVFNKTMTDLISTKLVDPTSGALTFPLNYASMKGKGFDLSLRSINTLGKLRWTSSVGLSYVKTTITDVYYTSPYYNVNGALDYNLNAVPGQIAFAIASLRWAGLDPATGDPLGYYNGEISKNYTDIMRDSVKNQVFHGSQIPLYTGFLLNTITWKGFSISANITGRFKFYFREPVWNLGIGEGNYPADYYKRWQKPGDENITNVPSFLYPVPSSVSQRAIFYRYSEISVKRGDNIRLQDVRLSYTWQKGRQQNFPIQSINFFFYPNNLNIILWRAEDSIYDPDYSGLGTSPQVFPPVKTWTAGLVINF